jgi:hypothetical protein
MMDLPSLLKAAENAVQPIFVLGAVLRLSYLYISPIKVASHPVHAFKIVSSSPLKIFTDIPALGINASRNLDCTCCCRTSMDTEDRTLHNSPNVSSSMLIALGNLRISKNNCSFDFGQPVSATDIANRFYSCIDWTHRCWLDCGLDPSDLALHP